MKRDEPFEDGVEVVTGDFGREDCALIATHRGTNLAIQPIALRRADFQWKLFIGVSSMLTDPTAPWTPEAVVEPWGNLLDYVDDDMKCATCALTFQLKSAPKSEDSVRSAVDKILEIASVVGTLHVSATSLRQWLGVEIDMMHVIDDRWRVRASVARKAGLAKGLLDRARRMAARRRAAGGLTILTL